MRLIGISGSLRAQSYNSALLKAASQFVPQDAEFIQLNIADIPLYNQEFDGDEKPDAVERILNQVGAADGIVIATPEYNYSVSGVLKNALDWLSRPAYKSVLAHKPVAIMSASMSPMGGVRAQGHLKVILSGTLSPVYPAPELAVAAAQDQFDERGELVDAATAEKLSRFIKGYCEWLKQSTL